ncbi:MAG: hypothetical protein ACYSW3_30620, partial [Planctomycetota bacterium]
MLDAMNKSIVCFCFATIGIIMLSGCKSYTTPGAGADMSVFADKELVTVPTGESIAALQGFPEYRTGDNQGSTIKIMKRKTTANFPVNMVAIRVQESGYTSCTNRGYGHGNYSVVTVRDIEKDEDFDRINKLTGIAQ